MQRGLDGSVSGLAKNQTDPDGETAIERMSATWADSQQLPAWDAGCRE